jgi:hypothetical protein
LLPCHPDRVWELSCSKINPGCYPPPQLVTMRPEGIGVHSSFCIRLELLLR